jgi:hypothetical protein
MSTFYNQIIKSGLHDKASYSSSNAECRQLPWQACWVSTARYHLPATRYDSRIDRSGVHITTADDSGLASSCVQNDDRIQELEQERGRSPSDTIHSSIWGRYQAYLWGTNTQRVEVICKRIWGNPEEQTAFLYRLWAQNKLSKTRATSRRAPFWYTSRRKPEFGQHLFREGLQDKLEGRTFVILVVGHKKAQNDRLSCKNRLNVRYNEGLGWVSDLKLCIS